MGIEEILRYRPETVLTDDGITVTINWNAEYQWPNPHQAGTFNVDRGVCMVVEDVPQELPLPFLAVGYATDVAFAWRRDMPVRVHGVTDVEKALVDLVDTARSYRAYIRNRSARVDRTMHVLQEAAGALGDALEMPDGQARYQAVQDARADRDRLIALAVRDGLLDPNLIAFAAKVNPAYVEHMTSWVDPVPPSYYLSLKGFADRLGVTSSTIKAYRSEGKLPEPDVMIGGSPGWLIETADRYAASRKGQGFRSDLVDGEQVSSR